jgi:hypothetical protein
MRLSDRRFSIPDRFESVRYPLPLASGQIETDERRVSDAGESPGQAPT